MNQDDMKKEAAQAALQYIEQDATVGVGTGSTVNHFIDSLATIKGKIDGAVASSIESAERLKQHGIPVFDLNSVLEVSIYVDGADEFNDHFYMVKGGGGAHTREKIVAQSAKHFVCIADETKKVDILGECFPVAVEVIPMARGYAAREIIKLGGDPIYRENFITDNGNIVLDVHNLKLLDPLQTENALNMITGVVENGIFARRPADTIIIGTGGGIRTLTRTRAN